MSAGSLTAAEIGAAMAAVAFGASVQATVGFGIALVAAPFLLLIDRSFIPGPIMAAGLTLALLVACRERSAIDFAGLKWAIPGRVLGTAAAAAVLASASKGGFDIVFGALVLAAVLLSALGLRVSPSNRNVFLAGTLSGFMGTVSSIGGPPMALVYQHTAGARLRATLSGFFVFGGTFSIATLCAIGQFGWPEVGRALILFPGVLLGFKIAGWTARVASGRALRPMVLGLSFAAGAVALVRAMLRL